MMVKILVATFRIDDEYNFVGGFLKSEELAKFILENQQDGQTCELLHSEIISIQEYVECYNAVHELVVEAFVGSNILKRMSNDDIDDFYEKIISVL